MFSYLFLSMSSGFPLPFLALRCYFSFFAIVFEDSPRRDFITSAQTNTPKTERMTKKDETRKKIAADWKSHKTTPVPSRELSLFCVCIGLTNYHSANATYRENTANKVQSLSTSLVICVTWTRKRTSTARRAGCRRWLADCTCSSVPMIVRR